MGDGMAAAIDSTMGNHLILIPNSWIRRREHFLYPTKLKNILALKKASKIAVMLKNTFQLWV